ncbi:MAG: porin [Pyramidobacter sp.]|nr:porin [Pyramidobacter sp.]
MSMKKMLAVVAAASLAAAAAPAFAANPFSDVPMNHWAYDAVEQLSAKGILEGYPNGTFKGNRAMTRYEIATMVARMMAAGGLSGEDLEKLKALVVEFQPELEALGVKVDGFDSRLSALEKGLGGLRIWGQLRFDYHGWDNDGGSGVMDDGFQYNRARLFMHKDLSDGVSFEMRWHNDKIDRYWVAVKDLFGAEGLTAKLGAFANDWEGEDGLHVTTPMWDDESNFFDTMIRGADLKYNRGGLTVEGFAASNVGAGDKGVYTDNVGDEIYGARLKYESERFFVSANGYWFNGDGTGGAKDLNMDAYWFGLGFNFGQGLKLSGAYFMEDIDDAVDDDPKAWKVVLDVSQDVLKFTDLRAEYMQYDKGWIYQNGAAPFTLNTNFEINKISGSSPIAEDLEVWKVSAVQMWGAKFSTYERYGKYDMDDYGDAKEWTVGVGYQYSPNLAFYLDYTDFDGRMNGTTVDPTYDNNLVRFRTFLNF